MAGKIIISTGNLKQDYQVIDAVFAMDSHKAGIFASADPEKAFDSVKEKLRKTCAKLKGDAVINCQFDYRIAQHKSAQVIEIFAYGTAVKFD